MLLRSEAMRKKEKPHELKWGFFYFLKVAEVSHQACRSVLK